MDRGAPTLFDCKVEASEFTEKGSCKHIGQQGVLASIRVLIVRKLQSILVNSVFLSNPSKLIS